MSVQLSYADGDPIRDGIVAAYGDVQNNLCICGVSVMALSLIKDQFDEGALNDKDQYCSGKELVRQRPSSVNDVIETRIAVVGNSG
jgi:hypothetical protein